MTNIKTFSSTGSNATYFLTLYPEYDGWFTFALYDRCLQTITEKEYYPTPSPINIYFDSHHPTLNLLLNYTISSSITSFIIIQSNEQTSLLRNVNQIYYRNITIWDVIAASDTV